MAPSRREAMEAALAAAVAAATPHSLFALQSRSVPASERFLIVALKDGRQLAADRVTKRAYLLTSAPARDGEFALSKSGSLIVQDGSLRDIRGKAESGQYTFIKSSTVIEVRDRKGAVVSRAIVRREPQP